jgi:pyruvate/oxaloacetate carboxyltransferase
MINLISGWYGKLFGEVSEDLKQLAKEKKEPITSRPADFIENNFEESKKDLQNFCKKNSLKDLSKSEENILSFALFPYSASDFFNTISNESSLN